MAKGDVVGVAAYPDESPGMVRLQLDDGHGGETPGEQVVWCPERNVWCERKPDEEVTDEDRLKFRRRPVPGRALDSQPPHEPATIPAEVVLAGVTAKAGRMLAVGGKKLAREYLDHVQTNGLVTHDDAVNIGAVYGVTVPQPKEG